MRISSLSVLTQLVRAVPLVALLAAPVAAQLPASWTEVAAGATAPAPRGSHAMAFDSLRQRVVMFGGLDNAGQRGDTWEWDGISWLQLSAAPSPSPRYGHAMAYDASRQRVVLFGGFSAPGIVSGDTWEWDGSTWLQRSPSLSPPARYFHAMAYDALRQRVVLFGGNNSFGDTWEWDGSNWAQATATGPAARHGHSMAYDAARQRVVLFGGWNGNHLGDTWAWNGSFWAAVFTTNYPSARSGHGMAYDAARQRLVLIGGDSTPGFMNDTWELTSSNWVQQAPPVNPAGRAFHAMAYDSARQRVVLFAGHDNSGDGLAADTWINGAPPVVATSTPYGSGCGSPQLAMSPDATARPVLGQLAGATIYNAPTTIGAVALGFSNQFFGPFQLPVTLSGIGMLGCYLWQSAEIMGFPVYPLTASSLSFQLLIPQDATLLGTHAYIQGYVLAPGQNDLQVIASNGIDWLFGDL